MTTTLSVVWILLVTLLIVTLLVHILTMPKKISGQTSRINRAIDVTLKANGIRTLVNKISFVVFLLLVLAISVLAYFYASRGGPITWSFG